MRIVIAGPASVRARLRARIGDAPIDVVGEFASIGAARAAGLDADGILVDAGGILVAASTSDDQLAFEEPLTPREIEVLELLAEGLSNKRIAERLGISDQTVKFHAASIMAKLGAANRTDAVRRAARRGLIAL